VNSRAQAFQHAGSVDSNSGTDTNSHDALAVFRSVNGECHGVLTEREHTRIRTCQEVIDGADTSRACERLHTALRHFGGLANGLGLRKFEGGDRPLPIMALDRDPQAVKLVKPDVLYRSSLSVREDHGLSDQLRASFFAAYVRIVVA
jgi:hypothetical protein